MSIAPVVQGDETVEQVREAFTAMQAWPHWPEIARGAQKDYGLSKEDFFRILPEYQRFMALLRGYPGLGMLSEHVDILWHSMILNTRRYQEFCDQFIGRFVHHLPCSSYVLYGFSEQATSTICSEPPATCTDPWPAPPDPSPVPDERAPGSLEQMQKTIRDGSPRFVAAYTSVFGSAPNEEIWPRVTLIDAIAQ